MDIPKQPVSQYVKQSPPVDLSVPYNPEWMRGKHIIITGAASGFGAAFAKKWAAHGCSLVLSDIDEKKGEQVVQSIYNDTGNSNVHFFKCDVRSWDEQVELFKEAVKLSPHGGIDVVVANAGIAGIEPLQDVRNDFSGPAPKKPNFRVIDINLYGVLYTTQLALYWLPRNPKSNASSPSTAPAPGSRDRHLLLIGSLASLAPIATQPLYGVSKHGVLGLFRTLRVSSFVDGVRVNMLCPYFIKTGIMPAGARVLLAGGGVGDVEDVVDAGSRLVADSRIVGRALVVGPKVHVKQKEHGDWELVHRNEGEGEERAVWEAYADDLEDVDAFTKRLVNILRRVEVAKGWGGWLRDVVSALKYGIFG